MRQLGTRGAIMVILLGGLVALFGTYWDDAWHTDLGRDTFTSPPHLMLYSGVTLAGIGVGIWGLSLFFRHQQLSMMIRNPPFLLALVGIAATFVSAPVDDFWHNAFGRDAVLWSPPHMLGVVALLMVTISLLLEARHVPGRTGSLFTYGAGVLVLAALLVPVMEYETDVPQFALQWYFPVMAFGISFAFGLIKLTLPGRWSSTITALVYTGLRIMIVGFLIGLRHSLPFVPPVILLGLVMDWTFRLRWSILSRAVIFSIAVYLIYIPYLNFIGPNWGIEISDVLTSIPVTVLAVCSSQWLLMSKKHPPASVGVTLLTVVLLVALPSFASAHDPGQGENIGQARLIAVQQNSNVEISAELTDSQSSCSNFTPFQIVARRAGETKTAALISTSNCRFEGNIQLSEQGRWFIYVNWSEDNQQLESWLPVIIQSTTSSTERIAPVYTATTASGSAEQTLAGIGIYILNILLLGGSVVIVRRSASQVE